MKFSIFNRPLPELKLPRLHSNGGGGRGEEGLSLTLHAPRASRPAPRFAFTLVEMIITTGLLGFIVLGLTAMFVQTQKAFRAGTAQTDVLESGRAVTDLLSRELEGITPSGLNRVTNFFTAYTTYSTITLPGGAGVYRTNVLQYFFMLTEYNQKWKGVGYVVAFTNAAFPPTPIDSRQVGSLYRWQYPISGDGVDNPAGLSAIFQTNALPAVNSGIISANLERVADGVVQLRLRSYDLSGVALDSGLTPGGAFNNVANTIFMRTSSGNNAPRGEVTFSSFEGDAVPAFLDLELGVLEPDVWDRFKSQPNASVALGYLARQAGHLHVFRRRIAIHNVDAGAYQ